LENLISDEDELNDNPDYIKNKLNEEEKELISLYKNNNIEFRSSQYVRPFFEIQEISNPKKILKNELDYFCFSKNLYLKPIIFPQPGILENMHNSTFISNTFNESKLEKSHIVSNNSNSLSQANNNPNTTNQNLSIQNDKKDVKALIDPNEYQLIDFGEKSYEKLCLYISKSNCLMWLGKFSPSIVENLFENYSILVKAIHDRKTYLRERFAELMMEEEKKLDESDQKAKKHLFNVFVKGKTSYEFIKTNYRHILSLLQGNNPNEEEEDLIQDDEQFNYEMNILIDHFINEEFEIINDILSGQVVKGNVNIHYLSIFPIYS
jgi:hypothetical protein